MTPSHGMHTLGEKQRTGGRYLGFIWSTSSRHTGLWNGKRTQDAHIQHTTQSAQQTRLLLQPQRNPALVEDAPIGGSGRSASPAWGE